MTPTVIALPATTTHLRRLKSGLIVPATTGIRTFVTQRDMFPGYFDEDFVGYETNVPSEATVPTLSNLYEVTKEGDFRDLLGSFNLELEPLFWRSQDQILTWVDNHPQYIRPYEWPAFFPFIIGKKRFVTSVSWYRSELRTILNHFDDNDVRVAAYSSSLVLPQVGV